MYVPVLDEVGMELICYCEKRSTPDEEEYSDAAGKELNIRKNECGLVVRSEAIQSDSWCCRCSYREIRHRGVE